ncbi:MAG: isoleucine--tRNA ligase [Alphaproteobacteria bacterium]|nr:isoleucine--tRNA ligase [Alphaproteobacteria bacterium]
MTLDYKSTVFLPRTDFAMRANLPEREPVILAYWQTLDLYRRQREAARGREKFVLHDGPPYANGNLHIGHALNKILKDVINRSQQMLGKDANYVPGWDCHGLPIEWKIEEQYREAGRDKDHVPINEFRRECRDFAEHWIGVQRAEFERLGVIGDWLNPYTTMSYAAEAQIVREIGKFLMNGGLYRGAKPVMWSVVEKTALAEAEIEYHDHTSTTIFVRFPVARTANSALQGASVVIWTTTPWTIPGNRAVAYGPAIDYVVVTVEAVGDKSRAVVGERLVLAAALKDAVLAETGIVRAHVSKTLPGEALSGTICRHPLAGSGYEFDVPLLPGDHVTTDVGTGLVHTAPGHGAEDWELGVKFGLEAPQTVADDGRFYDHVPLFAGEHVFKVDAKVADALDKAGYLLARGRLVHSYPHSWRSKAPLIFRNTPQWFISMSTNGLREKALAAIEATRFVPATGRNRLHSMIAARPDWCVSRQRAWGVPITVFVDKASGEPLRDPEVLERIVAAVEAEGADCWFDGDPARFLGISYDPGRYEQVKDILDVWFDSGATHSYVLEQRPDLKWPASLYLEGSDQHRGWFHSSLLESCGTRGRAPYEAVLTHGFVLAEAGEKMSKSKGNIVAPQAIIKDYGADILRLWVVASDYSEDLRISTKILAGQVDAYRRLRNTLRYLLGALDGFADAERVEPSAMPELERWVLHRLVELDRLVRRSCEDFDFHTIFTALHSFCAVDLSALYFDVRKDTLYCDRPDHPTRRAARTVFDRLFTCLTAWLAPIIPFTAEEAWLARHGGNPPVGRESIHLCLFPDVPAASFDAALAAKWETVRDVRRVVTGALEVERAEKRIGASLQAHPVVHLGPAHRAALAGLDLAEIAITSGATLADGPPPAGAFTLPDVAGIAVVAGRAVGEKCERCWKVLPDVGSVAAHPGLCGRCADAVEHGLVGQG